MSENAIRAWGFLLGFGLAIALLGGLRQLGFLRLEVLPENRVGSPECAIALSECEAHLRTAQTTFTQCVENSGAPSEANSNSAAGARDPGAVQSDRPASDESASGPCFSTSSIQICTRHLVGVGRDELKLSLQLLNTSDDAIGIALDPRRGPTTYTNYPTTITNEIGRRFRLSTAPKGITGIERGQDPVVLRPGGATIATLLFSPRDPGAEVGNRFDLDTEAALISLDAGGEPRRDPTGRVLLKTRFHIVFEGIPLRTARERTDS